MVAQDIIESEPNMVSRSEIFVEALRPEQLGQAYTLVQTAMPDLSFERWSGFAEALLREGGGDPRARAEAPAPRRCGILLAHDSQGLLLGLVVYRHEHDLRHGRVLVGEHFIALGLFDPRPVALRLMQGLEQVAQELGCLALHLQLPPGRAQESVDPPRDSWLAALLRSHGHSVEAQVLCKAILPAPAPAPAPATASG